MFSMILQAKTNGRMVLLYFVIVFFVFGYLVYNHFTKYYNYWKVRNVPGPEPSFFFGNMKDSALRRKHVGEVFADIYHRYPNEKVVGIFKMRSPALLVRDFEIIKHILVKDFDLFVDRGISFSDKGLGHNLFHADGDTWRVLRARFTPLFTPGKLKNMMHLITDCANKFLAYVETVTRKQAEQEIHPLVQKYTQAAIAACAFGIDLDTYNESSKQLERIDKLLFTANYGLELDWLYPGILKKIGSSLFPQEATDFFRNLTKRVIKERNGKPTNRNDFVDLILALRDKQIQSKKNAVNDKQLGIEINDDMITAQSFAFYAAGYETSASTMAFMLYELALNPDVQDELVLEIDEAIEKNGGDFNMETLLGMPYMSQVIDETLRCHTLGNYLFRCAKENYRVPGTDLVIEKGITVFIPTQGIYFDESIYPDPYKFDPERFSAENVVKRHPCAYMPFGLGPRNCIGMRFGQIESRLCIVKLLSKYRVEPSPSTRREFKIDPYRLVPYPIGGLQVNFVPRS